MTNWRSQGKQVLQDDKHFADAAGEIEAMMIVNALRAVNERAARRTRPILNLNECRVMRQSDEMVCACGLRWDVNDPEPPRCAHRAG